MKKKMTVLCGLLMAVLVTAYSVSGTYAKYTSSMDTTDSARVARWGIKLDEKTSLDIFKAAYGAGKEIESANKTDLVVAPGASGQVDIALSGTAEVAYKLAVELDKDKSVNEVVYSDKVSPIKFSFDEEDWFEWADLETQLQTKLGAKEYKANEALDGTTVTLYWAWAYDVKALEDMGLTPKAGFDYDAEDTKLGTKFDAKVTDVDLFEMALDTDSAWKLAATAGTWTSIDKVTDEATKTAIQAKMDEIKAGLNENSDPKITIALKITATQIEPTA